MFWVVSWSCKCTDYVVVRRLFETYPWTNISWHPLFVTNLHRVYMAFVTRQRTWKKQGILHGGVKNLVQLNKVWLSIQRSKGFRHVFHGGALNNCWAVIITIASIVFFKLQKKFIRRVEVTIGLCSCSTTRVFWKIESLVPARSTRFMSTYQATSLNSWASPLEIPGCMWATTLVCQIL